MTGPPESRQGHYAGAVTRLLAFAVDQALAGMLYAAGAALVVWAVALVTGGELQPDVPRWLTLSAYVGWLFAYFAYPWAMSGKTPGMALVGLRVVSADGTRAGARRAGLRTLALPLSFLTLGIGFLPIVLGRRHRALHDVVAETAVVYSWDARAARWRLLAREHPAGSP